MNALREGFRRLRPAVPVVVLASLLALLPFPTCVLRAVLGIPCPACGLTRATLAAVRLDFAASVHWHPLAPVLLVLTAVTVAGAFTLPTRAFHTLVIWTTGSAGVALIVVWVLRFLGCFGGPVPV